MAESKLYSGFKAPSEVFINTDASPSQSSYTHNLPDVVLDESQTFSGRKYFYFSWFASDRTYQIRWRSRKRKKPTASVAGGWSGWSSWQGANTCSRKNDRGTLRIPEDTQNPNTWLMANARPSASTNLYSANQPVYTHYVQINCTDSYSTYDAEQFQVQVRTWGEGNQMHGNHKGATLTVYRAPQSFAVTGVKLNDNGSLRVYYTTDWTRDGNSVEVLFRNGSTATVENVKGGLNGTYFTIPKSALDKDYDVYDESSTDHSNEIFNPKRVRFVTCDTDVYATKDTTITGTTGRVQSIYSAVSNPTMTLEKYEDIHTVVVNLTQAGGYSWSSVKAWAGWYDLNGKWTTVEPSETLLEENFTGSGLTRTASYAFGNVPSDIPVSYRMQVVSEAATDGAIKKKSATLKSKQRAYLCIGNATAALKYSLNDASGVAWSRSYAPNMEAEVCAGRKREVSRHGIGGAASMQVRGVVVYDKNIGYRDMGNTFNLSDWELMKLKTGADGYIALPQGVWAKVAVKGINIDTTRPAHSVTLDLEEVS